MNRPSRLTTRLLILALLCLLPAASHAGEFAGQVNFFLGTKFLEDGWKPVEQQGAFGVEMSWGRTDWPVFIASDVFVSAAVEDQLIFDEIGVTTELDVGVRKIWEIGRNYPFVGGGIGIFNGLRDNDLVDDNDAAIGPWVTAGAFWRLGSKFNLGLSGRWSRGDIDLFGQKMDAGGWQLGLLLGFGWPGKG